MYHYLMNINDAIQNQNEAQRFALRKVIANLFANL